MRYSTLFFLTFTSLTTSQSTAPLFPAHIFTIRAPEPCDADCQATICTSPDSCTPCGSGQCTAGEECGTWAGKADHCCIQPYNFPPSTSKLLCSEVASFLSSLDPKNPPSGSSTPKTYSAEKCPSREVIAAAAVFGEAEGNLTCCDRGNDAIVVESGTLSVPSTVFCVPELSAGGSGSSGGNGNSGGNGENGTNNAGGNTNDGGRLMMTSAWMAVAGVIAAAYAYA